MQVMAEESRQAAIWHYENQDVRLAAVWTEKKKGRGEDAPPTALHRTQSGRGVLAVYDGVGGAGGRPVARTPDGREVTGAFLASRLAHFAFEDWFLRTEHTRPVNDSGSLDQDIGAGMQQTPPLPSKVRGTVMRHLPTTLAAVEYELKENCVYVVARWAGDSRAYLLNEKEGLQAITRDDTENGDALAVLINDQPMKNMISADQPVRIHNNPLGAVMLPIMLVCATDGFFNYVPTPAHFEHLLLVTMLEAPDLRSWTIMLADRVQEYSGDDASLAAVAFGYPTFGAMQHAFRPRSAFLDKKYVQLIGQIDPGRDREHYVEVRQSCWEDYRQGYEKFIRAMGVSR
jgi:hypothetical protein